MTPVENMSQTGSTCLLSVRTIIYGATQPGVPQRQKRYLSISQKVARPKSTMTGVSPSERIITFSGLMSLCIHLSSCICLSPYRSPSMMVLISSIENIPNRLLMRLYSQPPLRTSRITQIELDDSYTPSKCSIFGWPYQFRALIMLSQFTKLSLPFLLLKHPCLLNALQANKAPSVSRLTS